MTTRALVVVSYGSHALLSENLPPWTAPAARGWQVVVVDNPTTPAERSAVRALCDAHGWTLVAPATNLGFGGGCRAGVEAALGSGATSVVLLNPDARLAPDAADTLASRVEDDEQLVLAPRIVRPDGTTWFDGAELDPRTGRTASRRPSGPGTVLWLTGACLAMSVSAWRRLDGFDDELFLYWEDVELSWRWQQEGGRLAIADDLVCVHDQGGTQRSADDDDRAKSPLYYYYNCRNRLLVAARHLDGRGRLAWALRSPAHARRVVLRGGRRQLLRPWRNVLPATRGTVSGLRALLSVPRASRPHPRRPSGNAAG